MRLRIRFCYRADTGEVETFLVEDIGRAERAPDHDAVHDRVTADIARLIERDALIEEVLPGAMVDGQRSAAPLAEERPQRERTVDGEASG